MTKKKQVHKKETKGYKPFTFIGDLDVNTFSGKEGIGEQVSHRLGHQKERLFVPPSLIDGTQVEPRHKKRLARA